MLPPPLWPLRAILFCLQRRDVPYAKVLLAEKHPVGDDKKRKLTHCGPVHTLLHTLL